MSELMKMKPQDLRSLCNSSKEMRKWCTKEQSICRKVFPSFRKALLGVFNSKYTYAEFSFRGGGGGGEVVIGVRGHTDKILTLNLRKDGVAPPDLVQNLYRMLEELESLIPKRLVTDFTKEYYQYSSMVGKRGDGGLRERLYPIEIKIRELRDKITDHLRREQTALSAWALRMKILESQSNATTACK